jgi:hypothetical protein
MKLGKPVAMVGWSGAGSFEDLETTATRKLAPSRGRTVRVGDSLVVETVEPVAVARTLWLMPGVAWVSAGYRFKGLDGCLSSLETLARRYLSRGGTFRVSAHVSILAAEMGHSRHLAPRPSSPAPASSSSSSVSSSPQTAGDIVLAGNSAILSAVEGARVNERKPRTTFRVSMDAGVGACGAQIRAGPGGIPTSDSNWVGCLVSGGERSSAMAWLAALAGFSVRLIYSATDDLAFRQVARLYSELSHRMDPGCLELVVLDGGSNADGEGGSSQESIGRIGAWLRRSTQGEQKRETTFAGARSTRSGMATSLAERFPNLVLPLMLFQDEAVHATYSSLGLGRASEGKRHQHPRFDLEGLEKTLPYRETKVGGEVLDTNTVIDAVRRRWM